jgi:hypothetical protein
MRAVALCAQQLRLPAVHKAGQKPLLQAGRAHHSDEFNPITHPIPAPASSCFFAHTSDQLRPAPPTLLPREMVWQSGAEPRVAGPRRNKGTPGKPAAAGAAGTSPGSSSSPLTCRGGSGEIIGGGGGGARGRNPFGSPAGRAPALRVASGTCDALPLMLAPGAAALPPAPLQQQGLLNLAELAAALPQLHQLRPEQLLMHHEPGAAPQQLFPPQASTGAPLHALNPPPPALAAEQLGGGALSAGWSVSGLDGGSGLASGGAGGADGWPLMPSAAATGVEAAAAVRAPPEGAAHGAALAAVLGSGSGGGGFAGGRQQLFPGAWGLQPPLCSNPPFGQPPE